MVNLISEMNKISPNKQCFQESIFLFGVIWTAVKMHIKRFLNKKFQESLHKVKSYKEIMNYLINLNR